MDNISQGLQVNFGGAAEGKVPASKRGKSKIGGKRKPLNKARNGQERVRNGKKI